MDLGYLKEFTVLAQTGNFLEAADQLFISQSTLSKHIKKAETELGVPLFVRTTRKVELSAYGEMLLPYAQGILRLHGDFTRDLLQSLEKEQNSLGLGSIPALAQYHITDVMVQFKRESPNVKLRVLQGGTQDMMEALRTGTCELAFIRETEIPKDEFTRIPYAVDSMVAVLPAGHIHAGRQQMPLAELRNEELLLIEEGTMLYTLCVEACRSSGFHPRVAHTDHKLENLIEFVQQEMGVALLMHRLALYLDNPGVSIVPLTPTVTTQVSLCHRRDAQLSAAAKHFLRLAKETAKRMPNT